jgi:hypothetical protein
LGIEPGSRENETDFEGLEGHYTRITAGDVMDEQSGAGVRRRTSDFGL